MTTKPDTTAATTSVHEQNLKRELDAIKKLRKLFDALPHEVSQRTAAWVARTYGQTQLPAERD